MGRADPNSMTTETVNPANQFDATYPGTRYGKGGTSPSAAAGDHSNDCKVVETSPGV